MNTPDPRTPALRDMLSELPLPCVEAPEDWFPERHQSPATTRAKAGCARCPIRRLCLDWALAHPGPGEAGAGVWGGMTAEERHSERRRRAARKPNGGVAA